MLTNLPGAAALALVLSAALTAGQDEGAGSAALSTAFLTPSEIRPPAARPLAVSLTRDGGHGRRRAAWADEPVEWLFVRSSGTQHNLAEARPVDEEPFVRLPFTAGDVALVGVDLRPVTEELAGRDVRALLEATFGAEGVPAAWHEALARPALSLRRAECAKLLVRAAGDGPHPTPSATAQSKSGQRSELRPMADPTAAGVGGDLPFRVYHAARHVELQTVRARHLDTGSEGRVTTFAGGIAVLHLDKAGTWAVAAHAAQLDDGVVEIQSATLTFTTPDPREREGEPR